MRTICKSFTFEAAHQLEPGCFTHQCSDCIHGHSYKVELFLESSELNTNQMVLDFGELKSFKDQIMTLWDHGLILHEKKRKFYEPLIEGRLLKREKVFFSAKNPTAETMAEILYSKLLWFLDKEAHVPDSVIVKKVRVWETATSFAEYSDDA